MTHEVTLPILDISPVPTLRLTAIRGAGLTVTVRLRDNDLIGVDDYAQALLSGVNATPTFVLSDMRDRVGGTAAPSYTSSISNGVVTLSLTAAQVSAFSGTVSGYLTLTSPQGPVRVATVRLVLATVNGTASDPAPVTDLVLSDTVQLTLNTPATAGTDANAVHVTGDETVDGNKTFVQPVTVGAPTASSHAATKAYADGVLAAAATADSSTLTSAKAYTDSAVVTSLKTTGDWSMAGALSVAGAVTVPTPTASAHAATKSYVDAQVSTVSASSGALPGYIYLDAMTGATDDDKLTAAIALADSSTTQDKVIRLGPGPYTFSQARTLTDGFKIEGVPGYGNPEKGPAYMPTVVNVSVSGGVWLTGASSGYTWGLMIRNVSFKGTSTTQFLASGGSGFYCALIENVSFSGFKSIIGSQAAKALFTASTFQGYWETNNSYNGAYHIGGSDNDFWTEGGLVDSGTAFAPAGASQYHLWFDYLEKTTVGPLYITAEGQWGGIKISGPAADTTASNLGGPIWFASGLRVEGRNATAPCNGSLIRVEGGSAIFNSPWTAYAFADPTTAAHSPVDAGAIHVTAGNLVLDLPTYDKRTAGALSDPYVYVTGAAKATVNRVQTGAKGGTWGATKPTVRNLSTATVSTDSTVTVVTV